MTGSRGTSFLIEWASRLQGPQSTSSTEAESMECGRAAKAMLRVKEALDQQSSGISVSARRRVFRFLAQLPITRLTVSTTENEADIMTKVLSARHRENCKTDFNLDTVLVASVMTHAVLCRHAGSQSLGAREEVFSCSCATLQLLSKLASV